MTVMFGRGPFTYTRVPIDSLFAAATPPLDGGRAQARVDRRAGAMALLLIAAMVVVVTLVAVLAVTQLFDAALADFG
jgi:hypothetical protein